MVETRGINTSSEITDMLPLLHLLKFKGSILKRNSHSFLVDAHQVYMRNLFLFCFGLSLARQFFGENIVCHRAGAALLQNFIDLTCFINGTFTIDSNENILYHDYYQWVSILLLFLAASFYVPFRAWTRRYGSFLEELTSKDIDDYTRVCQLIHESKGNMMFVKTWCLELFYAFHIAYNLELIDWFFNRIWSSNGWKWSAVYTIFPDMGKCFIDYITGGDVTHGKFFCLLPLSTIYRRVFIILYGAMILMIVMHLLFLFYRLYLVFRYGITDLNRWWCLSVARQLAPHWESKISITREMGMCQKRRQDIAASTELNETMNNESLV